MGELRIIGICGRKRHGKDSVGNILRKNYSFSATAFADAVKRVAMDVYGLSWDQCYGNGPEKEAVEPRWGLSPRVIMQRIGTEVGRNIHADTWVKHTLDNIQAAANGQVYTWRDDFTQGFTRLGLVRTRWVITDVRFPNEAEAIRSAGGQIWKVVRPSLGVPTDEHPSETSVDLVHADETLINDGTLDDLSRKVYLIMSSRMPRQ